MDAIEKRLRQAIPRNRAPGGSADRLLSGAVEEGLLDVAYAVVGSPVGELVLAATPRGLVRISLPRTEPLDVVLEELAADVSPRVLEAPSRLDEARRELEEYFAGRRHGFAVRVDWALTRGFNRKVLRATARIPYGEVATYRDVAADAGNERASRAAGNALHNNPVPIVVPCHRVVRTGGDLGGYGGGLDMKRFLLTLEGALPAGSE
jgi:methylated-DNA-[protein]-cysteine S-methyltransferase